jgi:hypothetical protein
LSNKNLSSRALVFWTIWREKVILASLLGVAIGAIFLVYLAWITPRSDDERVPVAVKATSYRHHPDTGRLLMTVEADLANGQRIIVSGTPEIAPKPGETIFVRRRTNYFGYDRYTIGPMP